MQKKISILKILAKYNPKLSKKESKQILRFLLPLISSSRIYNSQLSDDALQLIKRFNISLQKDAIADIRQKLLKGSVGIENAKRIFYLLYCNGAYTVKLKKGLVTTAEKSTSPEFASTLLTFINQNPYSTVSLSKYITSDANLDSYGGREELYFSLSNDVDKGFELSDEYSALSRRIQ